MKSLLLASTLLALLATPNFAVAKNSYSAAQCAAWFKKIDRNRDGFIGPNEGASMFLARITLANEDSNGSYSMPRSFFVSECAIAAFGKPAL